MTSMKRVGLIDNLSNIDQFLSDHYHQATAAEVMTATGGNTGNVAFVFGTRKILMNPLTRAGWGWSPPVMRERFDHLVVCCANQIGKHADLGGWADRLEQFQLPVTLIGMGAQADDISSFPEIPDGTRRFLEVANYFSAAGGGANIAVRGEFTQSVLESVDVHSVPLGCPSLMISEQRKLADNILARQSRAPSTKVVVAAGNPWHGPSATLERILVEIVEQYDGEYVLQHPVSMVQFAFGEVDNIAQKTFDRFLDVYGRGFTSESLIEWYRRNACVFADAPSWMRFLQKFDLALGPRYHGVALAIQAGVPGCVITIDSRTHELCEGTAIKSMPVSEALDLSASELIERSRWSSDDARAFDSNRTTKARDYVEFLLSNGLSPSTQLVSLSGC